MGLFDIFRKKSSWTPDPGLKTIAETAMADDDFRKLVMGLKEVGMADMLSKKGPFTVLAPNNSAFIDLPDGTLEALLKDKAKLKAVLSHHIIEGAMNYDELSAKPSVTASDQKALAIDVKGPLKVDGVMIIHGNIKCRNGYVHVVNKVILP